MRGLRRQSWFICAAIVSMMISIAGQSAAAEEIIQETAAVETVLGDVAEDAILWDTGAENTEAVDEDIEEMAGELLDAPDEISKEDAEEAVTEADLEDMLFSEEDVDQVVFSDVLDANTAASGECGANAVWTIDDQGTLVISGQGAIEQKVKDFAPNQYAAIKKVVIESGITEICSEAFADCEKIEEISLPDGLKKIGRSAFFACESLKSITIPDSVTEIGLDAALAPGYEGELTPASVWNWGAFASCSSLTQINVGSGNAVYKSIDGVLYDKNVSRILCCPAGKDTVTIPDSVTSIGSCAFYSCDLLESIRIPGGVTSIGDWAFGGCRELTSITIPSGVTSVEFCVFVYSGVTSVTIPAGITHIGAFAFAFTYLTSVTIPDSVSTIEDYAFAYTDLTDIIIPRSVTSIGPNAFNGVRDLTISGYSGSYAQTFASENNIPFTILDEPVKVQTMYRLYNPYTGEHLYSGSEDEKNNLVRAGWQYDGVAWKAPENSNIKVYRLYNPYGDFHFYSSNEEEIANLKNYGWVREGVAWCSDEAQGEPIYRLFNPYVQTNYHMFTTSVAERDLLVGAGWRFEGVAFYGAKEQ